MKYIPTDKLITEIEKWSDGKLTLSLLTEIKDIIASLQQEQPEVDLEEALDEYYKIVDWSPSEAIEYDTHKDIARHFYELGLNARKEE